MRIAFQALSIGMLAGLAACGSSFEETFNPMAPDPTKARVRIFNATNTSVNMAANGEAAIALNSNLAHGGTRCFNVNPATPGLSVVQSTSGAAIPLPTSATFEAGKSYMVVLHNPTTTTTNFGYAVWDVDGGDFTPHADSAGLRAFNAAPTGTNPAIDLYVNPPAVAPATEPALSAALRKNQNVAVGSFGPFVNVQANSAYQYRVTRTGATTVLINTTNTLLRGEKATVIISLPAVGSSTLRATTTQGC